MRVAVLAEAAAAGERRVAAVPETVGRLTGIGCRVSIAAGAGTAAHFSDEAYAAAGAELVDDPAALVGDADVVLAVQPPPLSTLGAVRAGAAVISLMAPSTFGEHLRACRARDLTVFALELVPRISRAQAMDVLSSQGLVAGYRAVLNAAQRLPVFFPGLVTAAGPVPAAQVLVLGTGVAGLSAVATARRLGAATSASDVRPSAPDEVRSLGATFLPLSSETPEEAAGGYARASSEVFLSAQRQRLAEHVGEFDAIITTAAVPGRRAPLLLTTGMVERMRPGSVIVDLAAETGGNCELTRPGQQVEHRGVLVLGPRNPPGEAARHASELFSRNVANLLLSMTTHGRFEPDWSDEIVAGCCLTRGGRVVHPVAREALSEPDEPVAEPPSRRGHPSPAGSDRGPGGRRVPVDEVASLLSVARRVVIVPGYGLAVARAAHVVRGLADLLASQRVEVSYATHPVAGRLPGHMDVLLDEAQVPHWQRLELEQANAQFARTDVVLVVGANDVVNPAAVSSSGSPLSGMPVLDVGSAREVVVIRRGLGHGFADVDNPLLHEARTLLLLGEVRETLIALVAATGEVCRARSVTHGHSTGGGPRGSRQ